MQNEIYSEDFEDFIKNLDILYVEDEDRVRTLLEKTQSHLVGQFIKPEELN